MAAPVEPGEKGLCRPCRGHVLHLDVLAAPALPGWVSVLHPAAGESWVLATGGTL